MAGLAGLFVAVIGQDTLTGAMRFDFNSFELIDSSDQDVLRRQVEFTQYASQDFRNLPVNYFSTASISVATDATTAGARRCSGLSE